MATLYEITEAYLALDNLEPTEEVIHYLKALDDGFDDKVENLTYVIKNYESDIESIKNEEKRLAGKRKNLENKITYYKKYLLENMKAINKEKVKAGIFSINIQKNKPKVVVWDQNLIEENYFRVKKEIDKQKIKDDLKLGIEVKGAELVQDEGLRIRWVFTKN